MPWSTLLGSLLLILGALPALGRLPIPGDARNGQELFTTQGCIQCHSVKGEGGKTAPDLGRRTARDYTPSQMASLMWNHAPEMWSAMEAKGIARPQLTEQQAADLFAYFHSMRFFEQPGDAGRGKQVFRTKRCGDCHGISQALGTGAKPVAEWTSLADPILLAQQMWNHAAEMKEALAQKKIPWPHLTSQEFTDLLVYLQNLPETRGQRPEFSPASAETGEMLFDLKSCAGCHTGKLALQDRFVNRTVTDFAAAMWNHAPNMAETPPALRPEEMRRIVGYLWSLQLFDRPGSQGRGKTVYQAKQCGSCHDVAGTGAPSLVRREVQLDPLSVVSALWQHGPAMLREMRKKGIEWPRFTGTDMSDLLAYLNAGE